MPDNVGGANDPDFWCAFEDAKDRRLASCLSAPSRSGGVDGSSKRGLRSNVTRNCPFSISSSLCLILWRPDGYALGGPRLTPNSLARRAYPPFEVVMIVILSGSVDARLCGAKLNLWRR